MNSQRRRFTARLLTASLIGWGALTNQLEAAPISLSGASATVTQDFNTLNSTGTVTWTNDSTISGWFASRSGTATTITASTGTLTAGDLYSYGSASATDRALGSIGSGNAAAGNFAYGAYFQNTTGATITSVNVGYALEQWRNNTAGAQALSFSFIASPTTISFPTPNGSVPVGWTPISALNLSSPITGGVAVSLNGNLAANRVTAAPTTLTGLSLAPNDYLYIRWEDPDHSGTDHGISIDDFSLQYATAPNMAVSPGTLNFGNLLRNAPAPTTGNVTVTNSSSATVGSAGTFTVTPPSGITVTPASTAVANGGGTAGVVVFPDTSTPGTLSAVPVNFVTPLDDSTGNDSVTVSATIGNAQADGSNNMNNFGPVLTASVAAGGSYATLASTTTSSNNVMGTNLIGSTAVILNGTNNTGTTQEVGMAWRTPILNETSYDQGGTPSAPPLVCPHSPLISDVVRVSGMALSPLQTMNGRQRTDPYVLAIYYDETLMADINGKSYEETFAQLGLMRIMALDNGNDGNLSLITTGDQWRPAYEFLFAGTPINQGIGAYNPMTHGLNVGYYGVNTDENYIWAVLDYNGDFAAVPEPSTYVIGSLSVLGLLAIRRRRQQKA